MIENDLNLCLMFRGIPRKIIDRNEIDIGILIKNLIVKSFDAYFDYIINLQNALFIKKIGSILLEGFDNVIYYITYLYLFKEKLLFPWYAKVCFLEDMVGIHRTTDYFISNFAIKFLLEKQYFILQNKTNITSEEELFQYNFHTNQQPFKNGNWVWINNPGYTLEKAIIEETAFGNLDNIYRKSLTKIKFCYLFKHGNPDIVFNLFPNIIISSQPVDFIHSKNEGQLNIDITWWLVEHDFPPTCIIQNEGFRIDKLFKAFSWWMICDKAYTNHIIQRFVFELRSKLNIKSEDFKYIIYPDGRIEIREGEKIIFITHEAFAFLPF